MMHPDDYTGSDTTGFVGHVFSRAANLLEESDSMGQKRILSEVEAAIALEQDPNWKGFGTGLLAMIEEAQGDLQGAARHYELALELPDPCLDTFDDTLLIYAHSGYYLGVIRFDQQDWQGAANAFYHCIPWIDEAFDDLFKGNIFSFLALSLIKIDRRTEALPFARAAVFVRQGEEGAVTILRKCMR